MAKSLSYSELWCYMRSKDKWYKEYVIGEKEPPGPEMKLGTILHDTLERGASSYDWKKALAENNLSHKEEIVDSILRKMAMKTLENKEQAMSATLKIRGIKEPIQLFGYLDGIDFDRQILCEYKSSEKPERWSQRIVDTTIQLSFYALMYRLNYFDYFQKMYLHFLNTADGTVKTYKTTRGPKDLDYIQELIARMVNHLKYENLWEERVHSKNRAQKRMTPLFPEPITKDL